MKVHIDLHDQRADLISPKPLRIKLQWLKEDQKVPNLLEGGTEKKKSKPTFYERMFKIDTKMKGEL